MKWWIDGLIREACVVDGFPAMVNVDERIAIRTTVAC